MAAKATDLLLPRHRWLSLLFCRRSLSTDFYSSYHHTAPPPPPLTIPLRRLSALRFIPLPSAAVTSSSSLNRCLEFSTRSASPGQDDADFGSRYDSSFSDDIDDGDESIDEWEEDGDYEPKSFRMSPGEHAFSIAEEVLSQFGDAMKLFAFRTTPRGFGCPDMEEIESYSHDYKKRLDEAGSLGKVPDNLALEVSSPGAERLLNVPDDLPRFQSMAMVVRYVEDWDSSNSNNWGFLAGFC